MTLSREKTMYIYNSKQEITKVTFDPHFTQQWILDNIFLRLELTKSPQSTGSYKDPLTFSLLLLGICYNECSWINEE